MEGSGVEDTVDEMVLPAAEQKESDSPVLQGDWVLSWDPREQQTQGLAFSREAGSCCLSCPFWQEPRGRLMSEKFISKSSEGANTDAEGADVKFQQGAPTHTRRGLDRGQHSGVCPTRIYFLNDYSLGKAVALDPSTPPWSGGLEPGVLVPMPEDTAGFWLQGIWDVCRTQSSKRHAFSDLSWQELLATTRTQADLAVSHILLVNTECKYHQNFSISLSVKLPLDISNALLLLHLCIILFLVYSIFSTIT